MQVPFSSLRDLFVGDEDAAPVYKPHLVALIAESLTPPPPNALSLAEKIYPELADTAPRITAKYIEVIGVDAMTAIAAGFDLWKRHENH